MLISLNRRLVPESQAAVSVFDHGFLYGDGIYETLRVREGEAFRCKEHLRRLAESARGIALTLPWSDTELAHAIHRVIRANRLTRGQAMVRMTVSRGPGPIGLDPALCRRPTLVLIARRYRPQPKVFYERGVSVILATTRRNAPQALSPRIKSTNFLNNILAKIEAKRAHTFDAVLLSLQGFIAEGTTSNVFIVRRGVLETPALKTGILAGVTRNEVLQLARALRIPTREVRLRPRALFHAEECFLTSTLLDILPVTRVNGRRIGTGRPGPITHRLIHAFPTVL
ncbi:MAG: aminotransferase class IV [Elusimicrobia bacterium]|nr:aminotransferase class IV [Elusimicrobiota bacterium]